jgi:Frag1/DRAM/Sfk1 family
MLFSEVIKISPLRKSQLSLAPLLVFVVGVLSLFIARYTFIVAHPEYFLLKYPSISQVAAKFPSNYVFGIGMSVTAICILISIPLGFHMKLAKIAGHPRYYLAKIPMLMAYALQYAAALFLLLLGVINSGIDSSLHTLCSLVFFCCQVAVMLLGEISHQITRTQETCYMLWDKIRSLSTGITLMTAAALLWLHLNRKVVVFDIPDLNRHLFVSLEYFVSVMCFFYAATHYVQMRDYYRQQA